MNTTTERLDQLRQQLAHLTFHTDGLADVGAIRLFVDGVELRAEQRADILASANRGEVAQLEVEVTAYVQKPKERNRKGVRVAPRQMGRFAASFVGLPVLRDHDHGSVDARAGTITESKVERVETPDGTEYRIRQRAKLVKQWAIVGVLDGTLDRLSVSFGRTGDVLCSIHNTPIFQKCYCFPLDSDDKGRVVEWVYDGAEGRETSFVNVPAVVWTSVDSVKQLAEGLDLGAHLSMLGVKTPTSKERKMDKLIALLGLSATATETEIAAAVEKLKADTAALTERATISADQLKQAQAEVAVLSAKLGTVEAESKKAHVDGAIANLISTGKLKPGSPSEAALRSMAARDLASFDAQVADLAAGPSVTPIGNPPVPPAPKNLSTVDEVLEANPHLKGWLKKAGITKEQFATHGLAAYQRIAATAG